MALIQKMNTAFFIASLCLILNAWMLEAVPTSGTSLDVTLDVRILNYYSGRYIRGNSDGSVTANGQSNGTHTIAEVILVSLGLL